MKPLICFVLLFLSLNPLAQASTAQTQDCSDILTREGEFQISRFEAEDGTCFFSVDPAQAPPDMRYRSYLFTREGLFMVFNSYSPQMGPTDHGARVFYLFPRGKTPFYVASSNHFQVFTASPGIEIHFRKDKMQLAGMKGGVIHENLKVSPSNSGGVELSKMQTLYLDAGFQLGQDPIGDPTRTSTFVDFKGQKCAVQNKEIFTYNSDGDARIRFSDSKLKVWLSSRCPGLEMNF